MAPPTGPARRTNMAPRGRGGPRRGGGPGRLDRDGDLVMDSSVKSNGISKRSSPYGDNKPAGRRGRSAVRGAPTGRNPVGTQEKILRHIGANGDLSTRSLRRGPVSILRVEGLKASKAANNDDRGLKGLLDFLERKSANMTARPIVIQKSHLDNDMVLYIMVRKDDAEELLKLNGWVFAGATLTITESQDGWPGTTKTHSSSEPSQATQEITEKFKGFLNQRYDKDRLLLDLSSLGQDPLLAELKVFADKDRAQKTFKVLMTICGSTFPSPDERRAAVQSVSLANNTIDNISQVFDLATTFPDLKHLDCSDNQLRNLKAMARWNHRFSSLETLLLNNNPIETEEPTHKEELLKWYPKLQNLSGIVVRTPEQIASEAAAKAAQRPTPIPQHGPDFRDAGKIGEQFLMQFFPMFDNDRAGLTAMFYDDKTTFSLSVVNHAPRDVNTPVLPWQPYLRFSRNLVKITHQNARVQRLLTGRQVIQDMWRVLPATKHPDLASELSKYLVDCHPLPALADPSGQSPQGVDGLIINIHGEFEENDASSGKTGLRSFSRTFVLGPGAPGGTPIRVVSDMLSLRAWNPIPLMQASPPTAAPVDGTQQLQQQLIAELSRRTNMTAEYSEMCLSQVNWNLDAALVKFEETKPNLGPEAFLNGVPAA